LKKLKEYDQVQKGNPQLRERKRERERETPIAGFK
jgi:hypothetical protein